MKRTGSFQESQGVRIVAQTTSVGIAPFVPSSTLDIVTISHNTSVL